MHEIVFANTLKQEQYLAKKHPMANSFCVKNKDSQFIASCIKHSQMCGYVNPIDFLGKTDSDIRCPASQLYEAWAKEDQSVIRSQASKNYVCIAMYHGSDIKILNYTKEYAAGNIIINHAELSSGPLYQYCQISIQKIPAAKRQHIHLIYEIIQHYDALTCRKSEIFFLLYHQLSAKQIATLLHRSTRTIQNIIDKIRCKLSCPKSSDLIQLAHLLGWRMKVPLSLGGHSILRNLMTP